MVNFNFAPSRQWSKQEKVGHADTCKIMYVNSFSSIPYYSNSEIDLKKYILNKHTRSINVDIHTSTVEHTPTPLLLKPHSENKLKQFDVTWIKNCNSLFQSDKRD